MPAVGVEGDDAITGLSLTFMPDWRSHVLVAVEPTPPQRGLKVLHPVLYRGQPPDDVRTRWQHR